MTAADTKADFIASIQRTPVRPLVRPSPDLCYDLALAWGESMGLDEDEALMSWDPSRVYLDPDYMTGGPGYAGPHVVQVWDGSPDYITVYTCQGGKWTAVNFGV